MKINEGQRALCHFFARFNDDHCPSEEWQSHVWNVLMAECGSPLEGDSGPFWSDKGVFVFYFGAYGCTKVVSTGHCEDALESAATALKPGYFTDPKPETDGIDPEDNDAMEAAWDEACVDLTYTESGYLCSWEWNMTECHSPKDLIELFDGGE